MTPGLHLDETWMWHPSFSEEHKDTAGLLVHFRKSFTLDGQPPSSLRIQITADTRYKLYLNRSLVNYGPVKGDEHLWFYDEIDIASYLHPGENTVAVVVLRFFHSTPYAPSFPRLPTGGLRIVSAGPKDCHAADQLCSGASWVTAIDPWTVFRVDEPEDDFLHVYEHARRAGGNAETWKWVNAQVQAVRTSTGNSAPWNLSPRMIPPMEGEKKLLCSIRNVRSPFSDEKWRALLIPQGGYPLALRLPPGSFHQLDLEASAHVTAFIKLRFQRSGSSGSRVILTYSESYEDEPRMIPYLRSKGHRLDDTKSLYGPKDIYDLEGPLTPDSPLCDGSSFEHEIVAPFHWRTFRFIRLSIEVGSDELVFQGFEMETANYPLNVKAAVETYDDDVSAALWSTSLRTLKNCMHDCYEDCPFYEQLQYAMDTRSSILFTYCTSADDRLARQAITQIHNSFQPAHGLTCSRSPSHKRQMIPHFSLYWVLTLCDHFTFFGDGNFIKQFLPVADAVLGYFEGRIHPSLGLVVCDLKPGIWNFIDWAEAWRPYGIPPSVEKSGISTYTNLLYAHTLKSLATVVSALGRSSMGEEYLARAQARIQAVREHCFDGEFFTDSLVPEADKSVDYSQHSQVWAVLSGAVDQEHGRQLLRRCLAPGAEFVPASVSMAFYSLRALSHVGGDLYDETFHSFWTPWREQLALGVTTWEEDSVSQRSDCHAWGSAPIYEFITEVAGIRPLRAGWSAVLFRPRTGLYPKFSATVPIRRVEDGSASTISVAWETQKANGTIHISLTFNMEKGIILPVYVELPGEPIRLVDSTSHHLSFIVKSTLTQREPTINGHV